MLHSKNEVWIYVFNLEELFVLILASIRVVGVSWDSKKNDGFEKYYVKPSI